MKRLAVLLALVALCSFAATAEARCRGGRGGFFRGRGGCVVYHRPMVWSGGCHTGCLQPQGQVYYQPQTFVQPQTVPFVQPGTTVQPTTTTTPGTSRPGVPYYVPPR